MDDVDELDESGPTEKGRFGESRLLYRATPSTRLVKNTSPKRRHTETCNMLYCLAEEVERSKNKLKSPEYREAHNKEC